MQKYISIFKNINLNSISVVLHIESKAITEIVGKINAMLSEKKISSEVWQKFWISYLEIENKKLLQDLVIEFDNGMLYFQYEYCSENETKAYALKQDIVNIIETEKLQPLFQNYLNQLT